MNLVLFDGDCSFCRKCVEWAAVRDKSGSLRFQAFQQAQIPESLKVACSKAVHVVAEDGTMLRAEQAALFVLERCGWGVLARVLRLPPLSWLSTAVYWLIARNRDLANRVLFPNG